MIHVPFDRANDLLISKYSEMLVQGEDPKLIEASLKRCVNWSNRLTRDMPAGVREEAFMTLLTNNLKSANIWASRYKEKVVA
jgi:hypothetical protein